MKKSSTLSDLHGYIPSARAVRRVVESTVARVMRDLTMPISNQKYASAIYPFFILALGFFLHAVYNAFLTISDVTEAIGSNLYFVLALLGASVALFVVIWVLRSDILYYCIRSFLTVIVHIFFRRVTIIGDNAQSGGSVIVIGNHQNQFVDGLMLFVTMTRRVSMLIAASSLNRFIVGQFAQLMGAIPVVRPQDVKINGRGSVSGKQGSTVLVGNGTAFTAEVHVGASMIVKKEPYRVVHVISDWEVEVKQPLLEDFWEEPVLIYPHLEHTTMFDAATKELAHETAVGIFPEGGSHDRTTILPLKAGVAMIALGTKAAHPDLDLSIVPCGLNYFHGHRFRGSCTIEFGARLPITHEMVAAYKKNSKKAVSDLLQTVEGMLRSVTINVPDYETLKFVHTLRQLYMPTWWILSSREYFHLTQIFAAGIQRLTADGNEEIALLRKDVEEYQILLKRNRIKNTGRTPRTGEHGVTRSFYGLKALLYLVLFAFYLACAAVPGFILNAPAGIIARYISRMQAKKAKAGSSVKISGRDVVASYKILTLIAFQPVWFVVVTTCVWLYSGLPTHLVVILAGVLPLASYIGVRITEEGIVTYKLMLPLVLRLLPWYRRDQERAEEIGKTLRKRVRDIVQRLFPPLDDGVFKGALPDDNNTMWQEGMEWRFADFEEFPPNPSRVVREKRRRSSVST